MILVVGSVNTDICLRVPHIPQIGKTLLAQGTETHLGGKGTN